MDKVLKNASTVNTHEELPKTSLHRILEQVIVKEDQRLLQKD
jgi:hypothetical protein